jgi:transposase-like protein
VHKTANVLNKVALSVQVNMKKDLREIYLAPNRASAEVEIDVFAEKYGAKHDKAVECLTQDRETMLAFYDFPAEHWDHLRTKTWRRLQGENQLPKVIGAVRFQDGIEVIEVASNHAA